VEVIPPPLVKELCDSLVPYYAFPTEPVILFADGGLFFYSNGVCRPVNIVEVI